MIIGKANGTAIITVSTSNGVMAKCEVKVSTPIISLPEFPLTIRNYSHDGSLLQTVTVTSAKYEYRGNNDGYTGVIVIFGRKNYDSRGNGLPEEVRLSWKIYSGNTVVDSGYAHARVTTFESFSTSPCIVKVPEPGNYSLEITNAIF